MAASRTDGPGIDGSEIRWQRAERLVAQTPHDASYPDPIRLSAGEALTLDGRDDLWDGHRWVWAVAQGRGGWIPDDLVAQGPDGPVAAEAFDAMELTVAEGETVLALPPRHGWRWSRREDGREGWVPARNLRAPD